MEFEHGLIIRNQQFLLVESEDKNGVKTEVHYSDRVMYWNSSLKPTIFMGIENFLLDCEKNHMNCELELG